MSALTRWLSPRPALQPRRRLRYPFWEDLLSASRRSYNSNDGGGAATTANVIASLRRPARYYVHSLTPRATDSPWISVTVTMHRMLATRGNHDVSVENRHPCHRGYRNDEEIRHSLSPMRQLSDPLSLSFNHHSIHNCPLQPRRLPTPPTSSHRYCHFSTLPDYDSESESGSDAEGPGSKGNGDHTEPSSDHPCRSRLLSLRNVGIFAHVDAGKTTVTERMLALSGVVRDPGSVDDGDTVTDYLPAERERGITIQSAAVGFDWTVPPSPTTKNDSDEPETVAINLIDTPGHVDFSVEVHRSVAVLDGAVLVVDAVAGVQAQTETVWRAIRNTETSSSSSSKGNRNRSAHGSHAHEPLPALMFINKMDREGANFRHAIDTVRRKLRGSNPVAVQLPLYRVENHGNTSSSGLDDIVAGSLSEPVPHEEFVGLVDLVHMRAIVYPDDAKDLSMEDAAPSVVSLHSINIRESNPSLVESAMEARRELISNLADVDEVMEDLYLHAEMEEEGAADPAATNSMYQSCPVLSNISTRQIQSSLRRTTLSRKVMPTLCGAALRGVGVEPVLDCVAEYLPCPLDRLPPQLQLLGNSQHGKKQQQKQREEAKNNNSITLGHPLHPSTLAYVFKVLHMKGRGGSGDGRVAFARVYSGTLKARDSVRVISPTSLNGGNGDSDNANDKNKKRKFPVSKIGGMLELSGGRFDNLPEGSCKSGDVCALVGLKGVVTGDTLLLTSAAAASENTPNDNKDTKDKSAKNKRAAKGNKKKSNNNSVHQKQYANGVHLAGLASPRPVLTLRVESSSSAEQSRLSAALALLTVEDPSLIVEETPTATLISGLGELHVEIVLDRLRREHGLEVRTGAPRVTYRETVVLEDFEEEGVETDGMVEYDRAVGGVKLQGAVRLRLSRPRAVSGDPPGHELCISPEDPIVTLSPEACEYFNLDPKNASEDSEHKHPPALRALLSGARGSLKRGRLGPHPLANLECHILEVESGLAPSDASFAGAMRAAAANAVTSLLESLVNEGRMVVLEPKMNVEISVPTEKVGDVLSDLTGRRGTVDDVAMTEEGGGIGGSHVKSMVRAEVPLIEILGYANSLRSLTGGEGAFSAEYKGHAPQDGL